MPTRRLAISLLFPVGLFFIVSRGAFELWIPKALAYALQTIVWMLLISLACLFCADLSPKRFKKTAFLSVLLLIISLTSYLYTSLKNGGWEEGAYLSIIIAWSLFVTLGSGFNYKLSPKYVLLGIYIISITLVIFSSLQQLNIITSLPGTSWLNDSTRPSSITGSYLHYPIVLFLLSFICLESAAEQRSRVTYALGSALIVFALLSYSRSAFLMLIIGFSYFLTVNSYRKKNLVKTVTIFLITSIPILLIVLATTNVSDRFTSAFDVNSNGNSQRLLIWLSALNRIDWDVLLIGGGNFGKVTNATSNITGQSSMIVESSLLQQIFNLGIFGAIVFYSLIISSHKAISNKHIYLKAASAAFIAQSFAYQNIEVFPAIAIFTLLPIISSSILARQTRANHLYKNDTKNPYHESPTQN
ncbi:O-antigen ligase family protein [Pseudomonas citronellolis]|uniref:O-antigen ligase family protein n=1 Tax=Pseudomonas citronellolis TaxID=53408 RepID=UPI00389A33F0